MMTTSRKRGREQKRWTTKTLRKWGGRGQSWRIDGFLWSFQREHFVMRWILGLVRALEEINHFIKKRNRLLDRRMTTSWIIWTALMNVPVTGICWRSGHILQLSETAILKTAVFIVTGQPLHSRFQGHVISPLPRGNPPIRNIPQNVDRKLYITWTGCFNDWKTGLLWLTLYVSVCFDLNDQFSIVSMGHNRWLVNTERGKVVESPLLNLIQVSDFMDVLLISNTSPYYVAVSSLQYYNLKPFVMFCILVYILPDLE